MGSYLNQCLASRQSIIEGARCRVVLLLQGRDYTPASCTFPSGDSPAQLVYGPSREVGTSTEWEPFSGFLETIAEDRGATELVDTKNTRVLLTHLFAEMVRRSAVVPPDERGRGGFNFRDILLKHAPEFCRSSREPREDAGPLEISFEEASAVWKELDIPFNRQRVFVADYARVFRPLVPGVMHEDAYQKLLILGETKDHFHQDMSRVAYVEKECSAAIAAGKKASLRAPDTSLTDGQRSMVRALLLGSTMHESLKRVSERHYGDFSMWMTQLHEDFVLHGEDSAALTQSICRIAANFLDDSYVMRGMWLCGIDFSSPIYVGQDYGNDKGLLYAQFIADTSVSVMAKIEERYSE